MTHAHRLPTPVERAQQALADLRQRIADIPGNPVLDAASGTTLVESTAEALDELASVLARELYLEAHLT